MLAGGLDPLYRLALAAPHRPYARVEVWQSGQRIDTLVPATPDVQDGLVYSSGGVRATLANRVSRTLTMQVREDLYPEEDDALLSPFASELRAFRGIEFGDGTRYVWQVFRGRIQKARVNAKGTCTINASDRAAEVVENGFTTPRNSTPGVLVFAQWQQVVDEGVADALFGESDPFDETVPIMAWEQDRARACDEMAKALGAFWYPLADGRFVMRRYPWTVRRAPIVTFADGQGGVVLDHAREKSRADVANVVTVVSERTDGTAPSHATVEDDGSINSATDVSGPFGRRTLLVKLNTPRTDQACESAARALLKRTVATSEPVDWSMPADAALELGDVVEVRLRNRPAKIQVVQSFDLPLAGTAAMTVQGRAQVVDTLDPEEA